MDKNNASVVSIWSCEGRSSRVDYFAALLGTSVLGSIAGMVMVQGGAVRFLFGLLLLPVLWVSMCACVRRLHDLGQSGWWTLISLVPIANLIFGLYLLFAPGQDQDNDFGPPTTKPVAARNTPSPQEARTVNIPQAAVVSVTSKSEVVAQNQAGLSVPAVEPMEEFWEQALHECESAAMKKGLWGKAFADAAGDEKIAKATYMRLRATQLQEQHAANVQAQKLARDQELQAEQEQQRAQEAEVAELLAKMNEAKRAEASLPKGKCPACDTVIPLASEQCPSCTALFTADAEWRVKPLSKYEALVQKAADDEVLRSTRKKGEYESDNARQLIFLGIFALFAIWMIVKSQ